MLQQESITDFGQPPSVYGDPQSRLWFAAAVLPEQFFKSPYTQAERPETALMRAVLEEALTCFQYQFYGHRVKTQQLAREAEKWFFSDDASWPFSFVNICSVLYLDPSYIRRGLKKWQTNWPLKIPQRKRRVVGTRRSLKLAA